MPAHEHTINVQLGDILQDLRPTSWRVLAEEQNTLVGSAKRPDILILEPAGWPVVIEAERENYASAEQDALARLGETVKGASGRIESAIALVYPPNVREKTGGKAIRAALRATDALEYALYSATSGDAVERLSESGWLRGNVRDLAMLAQRAAIPAQRVERLVDALEHGVNAAAAAFESKHGRRTGRGIGPQIAEILGQSDDQAGQTRLMAMTVLINALIFHDALATAEFDIGGGRPVAPVHQFNSTTSGFDQQAIIAEWRAILEVNYWPIFATAGEILNRLPTATAHAVLQPLWAAAQRLIRGGVTKSHDLTGVIFQRLIADRKFLATFYTRPASAALLAGLAIPADQAPRGADWGDAAAISDLQIGDFACGTGTLLSAAYQRISLLHELNGGDPKALHPSMMKRGLHGVDVLNIAVHLTAAILAGSHPDVPFDGECLLTMPYGRWGEGKRDVAIGSLDLLAEHVQPGLIEYASAVTAGGRKPEDVRDLISRVSHGKFDLVIMNPPFTRPTNPEVQRSGAPNPAYAAFDTTPADQRLMAQAVKALTRGAPSNDFAGLASHFVELAHRKLRPDGALAFVLPQSALSGGSWADIRRFLRNSYDEIVVVTIAGAGSFERSFSADTGMAECLVVATRGQGSGVRGQGSGVRGQGSGVRGQGILQDRAFFAVLTEQPRSPTQGALVARAIRQAIDEGVVQQLEESAAIGATRLIVGSDDCGYVIDAPTSSGVSWPVAGIRDSTLAQAAFRLSGGELPTFRESQSALRIPLATIGDVARVGPVHRSVGSVTARPRGPFEVRRPPTSAVPSYPVLWGHHAKDERRLVVNHDGEGVIRNGMVDEAVRIWETAARSHFNVDLQFNAQSLVMAFTDQRVIGGQAWPTITYPNDVHDYVAVLWGNSTLGFLLYWWLANKRQAGRGNTSVTRIPNIPTLDTRALTDEQHAAAREAFEAMRDHRFLPFDQIDEDPARAELDRRLLVDVLGLPPALCEPDGPIDLLRRKLAREPQIHGGKKSRVVFTDDGGETTEKRRDRD